MKKFILPLILLGVLSSYSMAHESEEKEVKSSEEAKVKVKNPSNEEKGIDIQHSGGTNSQGCHAGSRPYHCH